MDLTLDDEDEEVDSNGSDKIQNDAECVFARVFTSEVETVD